jgi:two-component system CheB/CheR fusion protein
MAEIAGQPLRILVVDDHRDTIWIYRKLLTHWGHEVTGADNHRAALKAVQRERLDLLLCDIVLPISNGYEVLAGVRAIQSIKAIAITGCATTEEIERIKEAGFDDYIRKPVVFEKLRTVVEGISREFLFDPSRIQQSEGNEGKPLGGRE